LDAVSDTDDAAERRVTLGLAGLFVLVFLLSGADLVGDLREGSSAWHLVLEGVLTAVGLGGQGWALWRLRRLAERARALAEEAASLHQHLEASRAESAKWRRENAELVAGLSGAIDRQLAAWGLSPAEKEVALLLLKGLSHKEVADLRGTGEATVRQQARALYKKAGLGGRHDLAAFFLEDLLGPRA
jgi:DNA-binding CsgD family transcriptional regulator